MSIGCAVFALAACASDGAPPNDARREFKAIAAPTPEGVALKITAADNGQNVTVRAGSTIAVELIGVPTAGYMWEVTELPPFIEAAGEYGGPTSSAQLEPGFAGGNHWEAFLFAVTATGEGVLRLEQRRPWEDDAEPATDAFSVYLFAED
jgi:predicted secreted protein